ncbi:MAG: hypothetical protein FWG40_10680 [Peptococcaceae bacterium]|nr:hypothetical protein [Peptococcaceae bacterium]
MENLDNLTRIVNDVSKVMVEMPIVMDVHCIKFSTISNVAQIVWTDSYYMQIQPFSKEMAVVLSTFQENAITYLLLQVFSYNSTWELVGLSVREYAYNSMNAAMLFTKTRELENEGKTILAILYANLLQQIIQPGIVYANTQEMSEYVVKLQNRVNKEFVFPAILSTSESEYDIVGLQSLVTEKGLSCYIHYLTDLSFDQIDALGIEGTLILENIDILFPGMTDGFDVFMIKAFHELPIDPNQIYPAYTTLYNLQ